MKAHSTHESGEVTYRPTVEHHLREDHCVAAGSPDPFYDHQRLHHGLVIEKSFAELKQFEPNHMHAYLAAGLSRAVGILQGQGTPDEHCEAILDRYIEALQTGRLVAE